MGSETSLRYIIFFATTTLLPSILIAIFSLFLFNVVIQKYFEKKSYKSSDFPNSYNYYNSALSIPLFYDLTDKQQLYVIDQVKKLIG